MAGSLPLWIAPLVLVAIAAAALGPRAMRNVKSSLRMRKRLQQLNRIR